MPFNTTNMILSMAMLNNAKLAQDKKFAASLGAGIMPGVLGLAFPLLVARNASKDNGGTPATTSGQGEGQGGGVTTVQTLVPDVQRMPEAQAVEAIKAAGLTPVVERAYYKQVDSVLIPPSGQVAAQEPKASATWVDAGTEIILHVSLGAQPGDTGSGTVIGEHAYHTALETEIKTRMSAVDSKVDQLLNKISALNGETAPH